LPETVAELVRGIAHQTEIRVMLKARVRHPRSLERQLGFGLGFQRLTLFMEDERQRTVSLVELDGESQPILVLHQNLDGSVVTRAHALNRDENRQLVKSPSPKIRNGVLAGKHRLEGEDCSIHVTKGNMGARPIEVRPSLLKIAAQGEILIQ